jgi:hypothetical protein
MEAAPPSLRFKGVSWDARERRWRARLNRPVERPGSGMVSKTHDLGR